MAEKQYHRKVQLEYQYDRLAKQKLAQVYRILVMDNIWSCNSMATYEINAGDKVNEDGSHLCPSILRQAKRRQDNR